MKKEFVKIVQSDKRGQIVIPKKIREDLKIEEGSAFWIYLDNSEIKLKKIEDPRFNNKK